MAFSMTTIGTLQFWWTENLYMFTHVTFTILLYLKGKPGTTFSSSYTHILTFWIGNGDGIMWSCALLARLLGTAPACALFLYSLTSQQRSDSRSLTSEKKKDVDEINAIVPLSQDDPDAPPNSLSQLFSPYSLSLRSHPLQPRNSLLLSSGCTSLALSLCCCPDGTTSLSGFQHCLSILQ